MSRTLLCAPSYWSGVGHRFTFLNNIKQFANNFGYSVHCLWSVSQGVADCRFEELFAPIPGIPITNISEAATRELELEIGSASKVRYAGQTYGVFREGVAPADQLFVFDLAASNQLPKAKVARHTAFIPAVPAAPIQRQAQAIIHSASLPSRVGIRVRVTECPIEARKPHRIEQELNETIRSLTCLPWYTPVFVATDSEYIEQMLASHFVDTFRLPKRFNFTENGSRYVHRQDKAGMVTFLKEIVCLCACRGIINVGTFLNQDTVRSKLMRAPYSVSWTARRQAS